MLQQHRAGRIVILLLLGSMCLPTNPGCGEYAREASNPMEQMTAYLDDNCDVLYRGNEGFVIDSPLLDDVVDDYDVFLTGETHGIAVNFKLAFDFMVYFHRKADMRYLLLEAPPSHAAVLNEYLETGDETWMKKTYAASKGTYSWTRDSYDFFKRMRRFNQGLDTADRIRFVGVDIEHQGRFALLYLNRLLPLEQPPAEITVDIQELRDVSSTESHNRADDWAIGARLAESITEHSKTYQRYLGDEYFLFALIADNIAAAKQAYEHKPEGRFNHVRDAAIYANFLKFYRRLPKGRYFGQFGDPHTLRRPWLDTQWFACYLEQTDSPVAGKVLSIVFEYVNCTAMTRDPDYGTMDYGFEQAPEPFTAARGKVAVLFKLMGEDSPLNSMNLMAEDREGSTVDYFQFLLMISDSGPTEPLGGW